MRSEKFGRLLKGAIGSIVAHEGKTAPVVEEELGQQMGLSPASIQRYKAGHIPPDGRNLEILAAAAVRRGYLNRQWLAEFLQAAHYPNPAPLIAQLYPAAPETTLPGSGPTPKANLPAPAYARFIERPRAYAEVVEGLQQRSAVVLIVSLGGMGKTSLAREIAGDYLAGRHVSPYFKIVVWVSDRDHPGATTLETVLDEIAMTLDYPGLVQAGLLLKRREVENLLRRQAVLLVVDNFETVTDPSLADWLVRLPEPSKALVTSRENLAVFRRSSWPVELGGLSRNEAREFLREKISQLKIEKLVPDVLQLQPLLALTGGNPKALELTLGYLKYSHQTLQQVMNNLAVARGEIFDDLFRREWETLSEPERSIFMSLDLFLNPAVAESLAVTAGLSLTETEEALERLVGLGLVDLQKDTLDHPARFGLHPLSRAFARARMYETAGFKLSARERQLDWYIKLSAQVGYCWNNLSKLEILDPEEETLHDLITWATNHGQYPQLLKLTQNADYFYYIRGLRKGQLNLGFLRVLAASRVGDPFAEIEALAYHIQSLSREQQMVPAGYNLLKLKEKTALLTLPDYLFFEVQYSFGLYAMARQEYAEAITTWENSLELARRVSARAYAVARGHLAICLYREGQFEAAESIWQDILADTAPGGFLRGAISSRIGLARLRLDRVELAEAGILLDEASQLAAQYRDRERSAEIDSLYARYFLLQGDKNSARQFAARAKDSFERLGLPLNAADIQLFAAVIDV